MHPRLVRISGAPPSLIFYAPTLRKQSLNNRNDMQLQLSVGGSIATADTESESFASRFRKAVVNKFLETEGFKETPA